MVTPQEVLKEYLNGINQVLANNPPKEDENELNRIKRMFSSSISSIDLMLRNGKHTTKVTGILESNIDVLDLEVFRLNKKITQQRERIAKLANKVYSYKRRLKKAGLLNNNDVDVFDDKAEFLLTI